jgi:hypothetical protein
VSVVVFDEADKKDAVDAALKDSQARGIIFSPNTEVEGLAKRKDVLN